MGGFKNPCAVSVCEDNTSVAWRRKVAVKITGIPELHVLDNKGCARCNVTEERPEASSD